MRVRFYDVAAGNECPIDRVFVDINVVFLFEPGDLIRHGSPVVIDCAVVEVPVVVLVFLSFGVVFSGLEGCGKEEEKACRERDFCDDAFHN